MSADRITRADVDYLAQVARRVAIRRVLSLVDELNQYGSETYMAVFTRDTARLVRCEAQL